MAHYKQSRITKMDILVTKITDKDVLSNNDTKSVDILGDVMKISIYQEIKIQIPLINHRYY